MLNSTDGCLDKPRRAGESVKKSLILLLAYGWQAHIRHTSRKRSHFFDLDKVSVFIDNTYWYFLKVQTNGFLLRWLNELLVPRLAWSHLAGTACIIIQSRRMRELSPKFLRLTSPGEQRSDDYMRPTFTPPRHACFQLITHTNIHTLSHYTVGVFKS